MKWPWSKPEIKSGTSLVALAQLPGASWGRVDAGTLILDGFSGNAVAYRCVRMIAEAAASIPLGCDLEPVARLLVEPSPEQAGRAFLEQVYTDLQITGNAWAEAVTLADEDAPRGLFGLRVDTVRVMTDGRGLATEHAARDERYAR